MRKVRCHECGKRYDFDVDDFCPKCGAFTQPQQVTRIGASREALRADGINEQNHRNSFVHTELHGEHRERKGSALVSKKLYGANNGKRLRVPGSRKTSITADILGEVLDLFTDLMK